MKRNSRESSNEPASKRMRTKFNKNKHCPKSFHYLKDDETIPAPIQDILTSRDKYIQKIYQFIRMDHLKFIQNETKKNNLDKLKEVFSDISYCPFNEEQPIKTGIKNYVFLQISKSLLKPLNMIEWVDNELHSINVSTFQIIFYSFQNILSKIYYLFLSA